MDKQEILFYEMTVATFDLFDVTVARQEISEIYHGLGNYYGQKYVDDRTKHRENQLDMERSQFYLDRAIRTDRTNVSALNDRSFLALALALPPDFLAAIEVLEGSLLAEPPQQRARYNLALVRQSQGDYSESERLLTEALALTNWENTPVPKRVVNLYYNRACARTRLAKATKIHDFLGEAMSDLREVLYN
jgi:tetratricopeptide (TPR) repeat protein